MPRKVNEMARGLPAPVAERSREGGTRGFIRVTRGRVITAEATAHASRVVRRPKRSSRALSRKGVMTPTTLFADHTDSIGEALPLYEPFVEVEARRTEEQPAANGVEDALRGDKLGRALRIGGSDQAGECETETSRTAPLSQHGVADEKGREDGHHEIHESILGCANGCDSGCRGSLRPMASPWLV